MGEIDLSVMNYQIVRINIKVAYYSFSETQ